MMMAWAQMDGIKERVQAKTMPNPRDKMISAAMREMLYAFSLRYWLCVKTNSSEVPMMAGPLPQAQRVALDTVFLKTMVHQREVGVRPAVELDATDHPLAVDQRDGIEEDRLKDIVIGLLHKSD